MMSENLFFWLMVAGEVSLTLFAMFMLFKYIKKHLKKISLDFDRCDHDEK